VGSSIDSAKTDEGSNQFLSWGGRNGMIVFSEKFTKEDFNKVKSFTLRNESG
jgi:hypothetical protein